jgi:arsenate reductase-like glutaredoxin family protein
MKLTGKKARKLIKKRANTVRLQEVLEDTLQQEELQNWSFTKISEQQHRVLRHDEAIWPLEPIYPFDHRFEWIKK